MTYIAFDRASNHCTSFLLEVSLVEAYGLTADGALIRRG